jgi:steroid delta-isomerase-like uncharacterized protein
VELFRRNWSRPDANLFADQFRPGGTLEHPGMDEPMKRDAVVRYAKRLLAAVPDIRLEVLDWAARGDTLFIEWRIRATIAGRPMEWDGADRFHLDGDRAVRGIAYFDTLPLWALMDPSMKRGHGELLDSFAARRDDAGRAISAPGVVNEYADAKCRGDVDAALERVSDDFRLAVVPYALDIQGREPVRAYYRDLFAAFPDYVGKPDSLCADGGVVVAEWRFQGTMRGRFFGQEPTGRRIDVPMVSFFTVRDGRLIAERIYFDRATLETQAGLAARETPPTLAVEASA